MKFPRFCFLLILLTATLQAQNAGNTNPAGAAALYEQGRGFMAEEDWYSATKTLLECLILNPAHAEGAASLADCYYELGEFDQALSWVRKARTLARGNSSLAVLEAVTLIALGRLEAAATIISEVLVREPYNREALFAAGELDIARGRTADALLRYRDAVRRYPDDRRLLISLALVSCSLGDTAMAQDFINRALTRHSDDYRVYYYAAYIYAQVNKLPQAINYSEQALGRKPDFPPARTLLANLRYRNGQYEEAAQLADQSINADRSDMGAWYLKGLAYIRLGRSAEALALLSNAIAVEPSDEFIRAALEDTLIDATTLEDPARARWANWHFNRAREYRSRYLTSQALFEYRRGLRLNPYAPDRSEYADLLRLEGYPARYLEELRFLQELGIADESLNDPVETYNSMLSGALHQRWNVKPSEIDGRHWNIAVFSVAGQSGSLHVDAGAVAASYIREILIHDRAITPMAMQLRRSSFSEAFRAAREANADYFLVVSVTENERDISLKGELFVGRTGAPAANFSVFRTGVDRLRNASRNIAEQLGTALPFRGKLLQRRQAQGLIDKGKADGVKTGDVYDVVKKSRFQTANEKIGIVYAPGDLVGTFTVENVDEEVSSGTLARNGFFDSIEAGDDIILKPETAGRSPPETAANPELRSLLRTLR